MIFCRSVRLRLGARRGAAALAVRLGTERAAAFAGLFAVDLARDLAVRPAADIDLVFDFLD